MIETCIANLKAVLAEATAIELDDQELGRRLLEIAEDRVRLGPGDPGTHRALHLLYNLPNLRPAARAALLDHFRTNLDLSPLIDDACAAEQLDCGAPLPEDVLQGATTETEPSGASDQPALKAPKPMHLDPAAPNPGSSKEVFKRRPPDLFDKLLDMVAGVMGK